MPTGIESPVAGTRRRGRGAHDTLSKVVVHMTMCSCSRLELLVSILVAGSLFTSCGPVESLPPPSSMRVDDAKLNRIGYIGDDPACQLFTWPLQPERAALILKSTELFADTGIYLSGEPPPQLAAFNILLDQSDPLPLFEEIARSGSPAGRLYALGAFQLLAPERAAQLGRELSASKDQVRTQFGCIGGADPMVTLVESIMKQSWGRIFREARDRTYAYYEGTDHLCSRR